MFHGVTNLSLDSKGRIAVPARYREQLSSEADGRMVVTVDRDRCLLIYPQPAWDVIEQKLSGLPSLDPASRRLQRLLIGHATDTRVDAQGRILIPPPLREFAGLGHKVVLLGQGSKFELWDEEVFSAQREGWLAEEGDESLETASEALSTLSF